MSSLATVFCGHCPMEHCLSMFYRFLRKGVGTEVSHGDLRAMDVPRCSELYIRSKSNPYRWVPCALPAPHVSCNWIQCLRRDSCFSSCSLHRLHLDTPPSSSDKRYFPLPRKGLRGLAAIR
ncbi:hypothetical protein OBBRIDRAFT_481211 [Obba rivulosa]|uniref:Uncharacterized protein n=1 Tax=Obba rivulosa TaxID=1052685 RepID=A0A8E2B464_9APHY|nr:hypothetical protein OBBRIDRAFT_481211 [Obba rivulosa]